MSANLNQPTKDASSDSEKWDAVVGRDKEFDGIFYYAVATTGIYCRPSCPARRANRNNVTFYTSCEAAELAGYRPCKRCQPRGLTAGQRQTQQIMQACRIIQSSQEPIGLTEIAQAVGLAPHHFHRVFKATLGVTPKAYSNAHRHHRLRSSLKSGRTTTEALAAAGLEANGRSYAMTNKALGMSPKAFRSGGTNETIRFAVGQCWIGALLVAQSQKGICAILLGDGPDPLVRELQDQFPKADLIGDDNSYEHLVATVIGLINRPSSNVELPLDIRGTAFQHRVWQALQRIPTGTTVSYKDLAKDIGQPTATRAVAGACAANKIAIAIPCHRVVRTDGNLSGYRWGVERKRELLNREKAQGATDKDCKR